MSGRLSRWYAEKIAAHSKLVILGVLVLTVLIAAGAAVGDAGDEGIGEFDVDSPETEAQDFVRDNYAQEEGVFAQLVVRNEGGDVLTRDSLLDGLRLQQDVRADETLNATLADGGFVGLENVVATAAVIEDARAAGETPPDSPTLTTQIEALEERNDEEVKQLLASVLDPDGERVGGANPFEFLPRTYEPGDTTSESRLTFISQLDESAEDEQPQAAYDAQVAIAELVDDRFDDAFVFGQGISDEASGQATGDSFAIITPFALVLILFVLGVAYRDPLDILLAFLGIGVVMAWLAGIMGWLEIPMNVILIAVPFLLIGLSIDYALHVVMRYREARLGTLGEHTGTEVDDVLTDGGPYIRMAMGLGLGSVILALGATTVSTGVGFLSNVVSPLPAIQNFAILSAGGILATFVAFAVLLPALKIELDSLLEGRLGWNRKKPAFGVSSGVANRLLVQLGSVTLKTPLLIIAIALLLSVGGVYGATTIDTEFNEADFLPQDAPSWASYLPGPFEPGTYTIADDFEYLSENFQLRGGGDQSQLLLQGDVTSGAMLVAIDDASRNLPEGSSIQRQPDGTAAVEGPHTVIRTVAAENESFGAVVDSYDETGDGLPNENVAAVYDLLFEANPDAAANVLSRGEDGEVTSARLILSVQSGESAQTIAEDTRAFGVQIEEGAPGVTATATGETVTTAVIQDALLETLVQAFAVTLVVILVFLTGLFWMRYRSLSQGALILLPVVASLTWLLGAMALLDIPFNSETAVITSLAIGLGVDYSIHAGERYMTERERRPTVEAALESTITGTGGALLASAATTAAGFGVLALALSPPLRRFGIVTGTAILFAFIAVVTLLPGLLILRERLLPGGAYREHPLEGVRRWLDMPVVLTAVTIVALVAGAAGWYLATNILGLSLLLGVTAALFAIVVVGALGTPLLLAGRRRLRVRLADKAVAPVLSSDRDESLDAENVANADFRFECPSCDAAMLLDEKTREDVGETCIVCRSDVDATAYIQLENDGETTKARHGIEESDDRRGTRTEGGEPDE